jgi:hypothetical protein
LEVGALYYFLWDSSKICEKTWKNPDEEEESLTILKDAMDLLSRRNYRLDLILSYFILMFFLEICVLVIRLIKG